MAALPLKLSGKVLILDAAGNVLLIRRSAASRHNAGAWEFPGGKNDPGEELQDTILREVAEETSLTIELGRVLGAAESALPDRRIAYLFVEGRLVSGARGDHRVMSRGEQQRPVERRGARGHAIDFN